MIKNLEDMVGVPIAVGASGGPGLGSSIGWTYPTNLAALKPGLNATSVLLLKIQLPACTWTVGESPLPAICLSPLFKLMVEGINMNNYGMLIASMLDKAKLGDSEVLKTGFEDILEVYTMQSDMLPAKGYSLLFEKIFSTYADWGVAFPEPAARDVLLPMSPLLRLLPPEPEMLALGYELVDYAPHAGFPEMCGMVRPQPVTNYATRVKNTLAIYDGWVSRFPGLKKSPRYIRKIASMNRYLGERYAPNPEPTPAFTGYELVSAFTSAAADGIFNPMLAIATAVLIGHLKEDVTREEWLIRYKISAIGFIAPIQASIKELVAKMRFQVAEYNQLYRQLTLARATQIVDVRLYRKIGTLTIDDETMKTRAEKFRFSVVTKLNRNRVVTKSRDLIDIKERYKYLMEITKLQLAELAALAKQVVIGYTAMEVSPADYADLIVMHETLGLAADIIGEEDTQLDDYIPNVEGLPADLAEPLASAPLEDESFVLPEDLVYAKVEPADMVQPSEYPDRDIIGQIEADMEEEKVITPPLYQEEEEKEVPLEVEYIPFMEPVEAPLSSRLDEEALEAAARKLAKDQHDALVAREAKKAAWEAREAARIAELHKVAEKSAELVRLREREAREADAVKRAAMLDAWRKGKAEMAMAAAARKAEAKPITLAKVNKAIEDMPEDKAIAIAAEAAVSVIPNELVRKKITHRIGRLINDVAVRLEKRGESTKRTRKLSRKRDFSIMKHDIKGARTVITALISKEKAGKVINPTERNWLYYNNYMSVMNNRELRLKKKDVLIAMVKDRIGGMVVDAAAADNYFNAVPQPRAWADIRAVMKGSSMYELIEFPRIDARFLLRAEALKVVSLWADMILAEMMPLSGQHVIEFVYYVTDDLKKKVGGGGNFRVIIKADYTKADIITAIDQAVLGFNEGIASNNEVQGSGNVKISLVLGPKQRRPESSTNATAHVYIQYMRLIREPKEMDMQVEVKAFANFLLEPHHKIRKLVEFDTKTDIGVCIFEAYYIIRGGGYKALRALPHPIPLSTKPEWSEFIAAELVNNYPEYIQLCQDGEAKQFLEQIYDIEHMNIGLYNAYNGELWAPNMAQPCLERVMLYYANHVYVSNLTKLLEATKHTAEFDGTNMYRIFKKDSDIKYARTFKPYSLNDMESDPAKKKAQAKLANKEKEAEVDAITHIHWGFDYETYSVNASGLQEPYLLVVGRINSDPKTANFLEYNPKKPLRPKVYRGKNCTIDFIFDVILPILSSKESKTMHHFWSYNGANFDFHFLIVALQHVFQIKILGSSTSIKTMKVGNNIDFLDLACWYTVPFDKSSELSGLRALAASCKTFNQKSTFEHSIKEADLKNDDLMAEAVKYCCQDVFTLNELVYLLAIKTYESFTYKGRKACKPNARLYPYSAAMLAVTIYKNCFMGPLLEVKASPLSIYKVERESYHGGVTLAFQTMATDVNCYDINSSYPYTMMESKMPYKYERTINFDPAETYSQERVAMVPFNDYDLFEVGGFKFPTTCFLPCLMIKSPNGSLIQVKQWNISQGGSVICWGYELRYALKQGAVVFASARHVFEGRIIFAEYVKHFYAAKSKAKVDKDVVMELFNKNLLNSLQGKLGEKEHPSKTLGQLHIISNDIFAKGTDAVQGVEYIGKGLYRATWVVEEQQYLGKVGALVRIPSFIAASGRINLIRAIDSVPREHVVYGDTDSITLSDGCKLPIEFIHQTELGKFKLELHKCADVMFCFGAKNYVLFHGSKPAITCKGVRGIKDPNAFVHTMITNQEHKTEISPYFRKGFGEVYVTKITRTLRNTFILKRVLGTSCTSEAFLDINEYLGAYNTFREGAVRIAPRPEPLLVKSRREERESMLRQLNAAALEQPQDYQAALHDAVVENNTGAARFNLANRFTEALNLAIRGETLERELELREFYKDIKVSDALSRHAQITQTKNDILNVSKKLDTVIALLIKDNRDMHNPLPGDDTVILEGHAEDTIMLGELDEEEKHN